MSSKKSKISLKSLKFEFLGHSHHRKQCRFEQAHFHHRHKKKSARVEFKNHGNDLGVLTFSRSDWWWKSRGEGWAVGVYF